MQELLMKFDPATGEARPYPSHAEQWRLYHGFCTAWLFNPWDGDRRGAGAVGTDPLGRAIVPPSEAARPSPIRVDAARAGVDGTDTAKSIAAAASLVAGVLANTATDPRVGGGEAFRPPTGVLQRDVKARPKRVATNRRR